MIYVVKNGRRYPFSKGILARSMAPTGLPLEIIYDIVWGILHDLEDQAVAEIDSEEIRSMVQQNLRDRGYHEAAKNYRFSRHFARYERSIVIMIGGTAGVGKSAVSAELARRMGIDRVIGTDTIREIMRYMIPRDLMPVLHESSFLAGKSLKNSYIRDNVVYAFGQQASLVGEGVRAYVERGKKEGLNTIINGVHLVPGHLHLDLNDPSMLCFHYILYLSDEEKHRQRFHLRAEGSLRDPDRYIRQLNAIRAIQEYIREVAEQAGVMVIENDDLEQTVKTIINDVISKLEQEMTS